MPDQISLTEFINRMEKYYPEAPTDALIKALRSTAGLFDTLLRNPRLFLDRVQLERLMADLLKLLGKLPGDTGVHSKAAYNRIEEECCPEFPIECGPTCAVHQPMEKEG